MRKAWHQEEVLPDREDAFVIWLINGHSWIQGCWTELGSAVQSAVHSSVHSAVKPNTISMIPVPIGRRLI